MKNDPRQLSLWDETVVEICQPVKVIMMDRSQNVRAPKKHHGWIVNINRLYKFALPIVNQVWLIVLPLVVVFIAVRWLHLPPEALPFIAPK